MWLINRRNIILMMVIAILISACIIAVIAYNSNTMELLAQMKVESTAQALLAVEPGNDPTGSMIEEKGGVLYFSFSFDKDIEQHYQFTELFRVRNNSADDITFGIESEGIGFISIMPADGGLPFVENGANTDYYHLLPAGKIANIAVVFDVPACPEALDVHGKLLIKAKTVE